MYQNQRQNMLTICSVDSQLERQKKTYNLRINEKHYEEGDLVYLREHATKKGESPKLRPVWKGPYLVISSKPPLYKLKTRKREVCIHHDNLKPCNDRHIPFWLRRERSRLLNDDTEPTKVLDDFHDVIDLRPLFSECKPNQTKQTAKDPHCSINQNHGLNSEVVTTKGRKLKQPAHLKDYVI